MVRDPNLAPGGTYLAKVLAGGTDTDLLNLLKRHFRTVKHAKPRQPRGRANGMITQGFKG